MSAPLDAASLDRLFLQSRSRNAWVEETLPEETWRTLYDLLKHAPTSMNLAPGRFVFVSSEDGKARLAAAVMEANKPKVLAAPCTVIVGEDAAFFERAPELFRIRPQARAMYERDPALASATAFRNSTLQGGYLIMAARALGLDVGPMSGFDHAAVDQAFFAGTTVRSNFLCALGHGADASFPRLPRLTFEDACRIV